MDMELGHAVEILERTPATVRGLLSGLSEAWIRGTEGPDTWSAYDIVGHLIHGEKTDWIPRAGRILEHGESLAFEPFDRFAMLKMSRTIPIAEMLDEFESLRKQNLATLRSWNLQDLSKRGVHPDFGPVTMQQLLSTWVVHDLGHLSQITRVLAKQYTEAVGPWRVYLPVLDTRVK